MNRSYQVSLYLKGDDLRPHEISALVGTTSSKSHPKGKRWKTSSGKEVVERTGLWVLTERDDLGDDFSMLVRNFIEKFAGIDVPLSSLPGVEVAYLDVLVMNGADDDGGGSCEFMLDVDSIHALNLIGLPVQFTAAVIVE